MKTTAPLSACMFLQSSVAFLLAGSITTWGETNLVISSFDFYANIIWSNALSGHSYALQRASTLETGAWFNVPGFSHVAPTNRVMTVMVPVSGPTGFYRVLDNGICCTNSGGVGPSSAVALGTICGDTAGNPIFSSGCGAAWYRATVAECSGAPDIDPAAIITLTQAAASYDLFIYDSAFTQFAASGQPRTICVARDDVAGDRTFDILIEVRPSGVYNCDNWSLEIRRTTGLAPCQYFP